MDDVQKDFWAMEHIGELVENWPKDSEGAPEEPVRLGWCNSINFDAQMRVNMLEAYGIPCICRYRGKLGDSGKLILGMGCEGIDLYVPVSMLEDAKALCEEEYHEEL